MRALDELIRQITADANGVNQQLLAFRQAFDEGVSVPCDAFVIGEPVPVVRFDYDGNERRGLTATCHRPDGREHVVSAADVVFPPRAEGSRYAGAYRKWMGLEPLLLEADGPTPVKGRRESAASAIELHGVVELAVLSVKQIRLSQAGQRAIVAFFKALTDERVRYQRAPFDHPSLCRTRQ